VSISRKAVTIDEMVEIDSDIRTALLREVVARWPFWDFRGKAWLAGLLCETAGP
jgi:hypothetical protein